LGCCAVISWQKEGSRARTPPQVDAQVLIWPGRGPILPCMNQQSPTPFPKSDPFEKVAFDRRELGVIMGLYGRMVAAGEWRDYAMSFRKDHAVFAVFRHTAEHPLYRIEKRPKLRGRQGQYALYGMDGRVLKRGADLKAVLYVLERKLIRAIE